GGSPPRRHCSGVQRDPARTPRHPGNLQPAVSRWTDGTCSTHIRRISTPQSSRGPGRRRPPPGGNPCTCSRISDPKYNPGVLIASAYRKPKRDLNMTNPRFLALLPILAATLYGCAGGSQTSGPNTAIGGGSFTLAP